MNSLIRQRFPGVEVVGSNYPPAASRVALAKLVNLGTFASLGLTGRVALNLGESEA